MARECHRGHEITGENSLPTSNRDCPGSVRCRACNRAVTSMHNWLRRRGTLLTDEELDDLADTKYLELLGA